MAHYCSRLHEYIVGYTRVQRKDNMWLDLTHNVSLTICISTYSNASRFPRSIYCLHLAQVQNQWKYLCSMLRGRCLSHHKLNCAIVCLLIIPKIMSRIRNNICSHQCFFFFLNCISYMHINISSISPYLCVQLSTTPPQDHHWFVYPTLLADFPCTCREKISQLIVLQVYMSTTKRLQLQRR